jgi:hypothetical protein
VEPWPRISPRLSLIFLASLPVLAPLARRGDEKGVSLFARCRSRLTGQYRVARKPAGGGGGSSFAGQEREKTRFAKPISASRSSPSAMYLTDELMPLDSEYESFRDCAFWSAANDGDFRTLQTASHGVFVLTTRGSAPMMVTIRPSTLPAPGPSPTLSTKCRHPKPPSANPTRPNAQGYDVVFDHVSFRTKRRIRKACSRISA